MTAGSITYKIARTTADFEQAGRLFKEYARTLSIDLSFQGFEEELKNIDKQYNKPDGGLLLAQIGEMTVGCTGIRKLEDGIAELKRMYVQRAYRGYLIGVELLKRSLILASELRYKKIRLDTLENMGKAQQLYKSAGFYPIPAYRYNPVEGTIYMEKVL